MGEYILDSDRIIDSSSQTDYPIRLNQGDVYNGDGKQIRITGCKDWKGLFILNGGVIRNLKVIYRDNTLLNGGCPIVFSDSENSAYGSIIDCSFDINGLHLSSGVIVGGYAMKTGDLRIEKCSIRVKCRTICGIIGPFLYSESSRPGKLNVDYVYLEVVSVKSYGFLIGHNFGNGTVDHTITLHLLGNSYILTGRGEIDKPSILFKGLIGPMMNEKLKYISIYDVMKNVAPFNRQ